MSIFDGLGELQITTCYAEGRVTGYRIDHADPMIFVSDALLREIRLNRNLLATVQVRQDAPDLLTIVGLDGRRGALVGSWVTLVYCIGAYDESRHAWHCYWPD